MLAAADAADVHPLLVVPFALLLLSIAVFPLVRPHWWEHNKNKGIVAALLGAPMAVWAALTVPVALGHSAHEYVSFILLLGSLFVTSGGLFLDGDLRATPRVNAAFLGLGAVLASFIGTTGASMLLIRPLLRTNSERKRVRHTVIFFIFIVSNAGGLLTPLGDPPLFLGYLNKIPFTWTLHLWGEWLLVNGVLLLLYVVLDTWAVRHETPEALRADRTHFEPLRLKGGVNLLFLGGVVAAVAFLDSPWREIAMVGLAVVSIFATPKGVHEQNGFSWGPIVEVAVLFAGIFATMIPALLLLQQNGSHLGVREPWQFFWVTGALSSFLDNAPTYLTFASVGIGVLNDTTAGAAFRLGDLGAVIHTARGAEMMVAISLGAVFMGANTYIGNGPNFMVKAIAEQRGVKMPSFFGYMLWSLGILIPLFIAVSFLWFA